MDSLNVLAPLASENALGSARVRLLGGELSLRSMGALPLRLSAGPISVDHGASAISLSATGSFPPPPQMRLSVDSLTRSPGATMNLSLGFSGQGGILMTSDVAPALSGGGSSATERGILPYATGLFSSVTSPSGRSFITYDTGANPSDPSDDVGLRPLNLGTEYSTSIVPGLSMQNVRLASSQAITTTSTINSLVIPRGNSVMLNDASLTISSGGIILAGAPTQQIGNLVVAGGTASSALNSPGEMIVHADGLPLGDQNRRL